MAHRCHYCDAAATRGYPDLPCTQHCDECAIVRDLYASVNDVRCSLLSAALRRIERGNKHNAT